jgi:hypothetical protein
LRISYLAALWGLASGTESGVVAGMKRSGEITAIASVTVGSLAAILKLGMPAALLLGLIVGCTMSLLVIRGAAQRVVS